MYVPGRLLFPGKNYTVEIIQEKPVLITGLFILIK